MTRTDLLALAERVEAGSGEDLRLAHDIWVEFGGTKLDIVTSLDAVEALRERLLPGSFADSEQTKRGWWATIQLEYGALDEETWSASAPTEPRARLAALLRAYAETVGG